MSKGYALARPQLGAGGREWVPSTTAAAFSMRAGLGDVEPFGYRRGARVVGIHYRHSRLTRRLCGADGECVESRCLARFRCGSPDWKPVRSRHAHHACGEERTGMHMATKVKRWTIEELHSLPEDGNTYELIHGELFVG